jgi:hypothetical protein
MYNVTLVLTLFAGLSDATYTSLLNGLGDHTFTTREKSSTLMFEMAVEDQFAENFLSRVVVTDDAEIRDRVDRILCRLDGERARRKQEREEHQARLKQQHEKGLNILADRLFSYYPFIDSLWYDGTADKFITDSFIYRDYQVRYLNAGTYVFPEASFVNLRIVRPTNETYQLGSKRLAMDMLNNGVSPLDINLLFQVMRVSDNLYLANQAKKKDPKIDEEMPPPEEP